jgi:DnaJ-class molecular chaperone
MLYKYLLICINNHNCWDKYYNNTAIIEKIYINKQNTKKMKPSIFLLTTLIIPSMYLVLVIIISPPKPTLAFFGTGGGGRRQQPPAEVIEEIDLYDVLGLDEEASSQDIKKAFRALSLKYHPDKQPNELKRFQLISRAYEILSSEELKYVYDFSGMKGVKEHEDAKKQESQGGMDPFAAFFGGGQRRANKGNNAQVEMAVTLEQLYKGGVERFRIARRIVCRGCADDDPKAKTKERCKTCQRCPPETRMVQRQMGNGFIVQQQEQVQSKHKCKNEDKDLEVTIEKGASDGTQVLFPYASEQRPGQVPGDVIVVLKQQRHPLFERRENQLHLTLKITLKEALTGFMKTIKHLDGHDVVIKSEAGQIVQPLSTKVIKEEGMPVHEVPSQFGDLHVTFEVVFPKTLTPEVREQLSQLLP